MQTCLSYYFSKLSQKILPFQPISYQKKALKNPKNSGFVAEIAKVERGNKNISFPRKPFVNSAERSMRADKTS